MTKPQTTIDDLIIQMQKVSDVVDVPVKIWTKRKLSLNKGIAVSSAKIIATYKQGTLEKEYTLMLIIN